MRKNVVRKKPHYSYEIIHPELKRKTTEYHEKHQVVLNMMDGYKGICISSVLKSKWKQR